MYKLSNKKDLLKLRNPWGEGEWTGNWGRNSGLWTEDLKREVKLTNIEDGSFFIDYADFKKNFEAVVICHYHKKHTYSSMTSKNNDDSVDIV